MEFDLSPREKHSCAIELPIPLNLETTSKSFTPWLEITPLATCHWLRAPFRRERKYYHSEYILFALKKENPYSLLRVDIIEEALFNQLRPP